MIFTFSSAGSSLSLIMLIACLSCTSSKSSGVSQTATPPVELQASGQSTVEQNPLLAEWTGPYGGVPSFHRMNLEDISPAITKGISLHLAEMDAIANNPQAPTFENTIEAMEKAGQSLRRAMVYYGIWSNNTSSPEFRKIQAEIAPQLAQYQSQISGNKKLFERIKAVYEQASRQPLPAGQQRVAELTYEEFVMEGASLDEGAKRAICRY
jgi:peptidyl-dipeptidase Dcp